MDKVNTRELVVDMLLAMEKGEGYSHQVIGNGLNKYDYIGHQDKAFMKRLVEGTLERRIEMDYIIDLFSKTPVRKMKPLIRQTMRMSVYQIMYMDYVPDSAVCNEAVKLVAKRKFQNLKGFVNGVLRNISREKGNILYPEKEKDFVKYISVTYSMPEWIVKELSGQYGEERCESILKSFMKPFPVSLRYANRDDKELWIEKARENGVQIKPHPFLPYAYQATNLDGVCQIAGYEEGAVTVQDVSSMLLSECAGMCQGKTVLDVCAAPGGKTMHMAERVGCDGHVIARDVSDKKVLLLEENCMRMRLNNVTTEVFDATLLDNELVNRIDIVLCDVPCSGLGIMGKKRDIKYNLNQESLGELNALQKQIVRNAAQYVKPGGVLLYSTCTIRSAENEQMVKWIEEELSLNPDSIEPYVGKCIQSDTIHKGYIQLLPDEYETDGFFIARFIKPEKV